MKNKERDSVRLQHILDAIRLIERFSKDVSFDQFADDLMMQNAIIRQFEIIGEATANISNELKESSSNVEWSTIKGFRNLLVHEYFRVDITEVWLTVKNDIPILKEQIQPLIEPN